jgi:hypothetical protein
LIYRFIALVTLCAAGTVHVSGESKSSSKEQDPLFREIDSIVEDLSRVTGLKRLKSVQYGRITKEGFRKFLESRIDTMIKPEEIRAEEITLKMFGFVPRDYDLKGGTIELMSEQAAAFYDYRTKKLYIVDTAISDFQDIALVHELAHALADQHFNLEKFVDPGRSDDAALARMAVIEGQATWLMLEHMVRKTGQSLLESPGLAKMMNAAGQNVTGLYPTLDKSPLYMRETLLFPYTTGMAFMQAAIVRNGKDAFSDVFRKPPSGTNHILHPEQYFGTSKMTEPEAPSVPIRGRYRTLSEGRLGELDHRILIQQYAGSQRAEALSVKLRGSAYRVLEDKAGGARTILAYASEWADASSAKEYFDLYESILRGKSKSAQTFTRDEFTLRGTDEAGHWQVRLSG